MHILGPTGQLRLLLPIYKNSGIEELVYNRVSDSISHKILYSRMRSSKSIEFIYEKSSYSKIIGLSKNLRKKLKSTFPDLKNSRSPLETFHLYRRVKIDHSHFLSRVGFLIDENYKIQLKYPPDIPILPSAIRSFLASPEQIFMPLNIWDGVVSANEWHEKGILIKNLGKIYPLYGVWPPTSNEYIDLFADFVSGNKLKGVAVDLGCGSGVLGLILAKAGMSVFGIDNSLQAAKSSNLNAQALGLDFNAVQGDAGEMSIPNCDILVCNPPWMPGVPSGLLDSGNYDPDEHLLKSAFMQTKKLNLNGKFLLIYSDLAEKIGLQRPGRISELCKQHDLVVKDIFSVPFPITFDNTHPLKSIRDDSKISLYEITRL